MFVSQLLEMKYLAVLEKPRLGERPKARNIVVEAKSICTAANLAAAKSEPGERVVAIKEFGQ